MQVQIGLLTWTDQDSWYWGAMVIQAGYNLLNADRKNPDRISPSIWVIVLPPYLLPRNCIFLDHLTASTLLITTHVKAGLAATDRSRYPFCIAHPRRVQSHLPHYLDLIQHLTSGRLAFA